MYVKAHAMFEIGFVRKKRVQYVVVIGAQIRLASGMYTFIKCSGRRKLKQSF
jgi:hypothetical protein